MDGATSKRSGLLGESFIISKSVALVQHSLYTLGLPKERIPSDDTVLWSSLVATIGYLFYLNQSEKVKRLKQELQESQEKLRYLQEKLLKPTIEDSASSIFRQRRRPVRIFMDGAFDLLHFGHMNAFRLGRSLGSELVVGLNSDESITQCKGQPLMNDHERLTMVSSCKFVDEVIPGCPYIMSEKYLDYVITKYNIDYVVHGDDPCIVDGKDVYDSAKKAGKYRSIPRTEGVSTTDIVGRMLLLTKDHHRHEQLDTDIPTDTMLGPSVPPPSNPHFFTTSRMLQLFSANRKAPAPGARIVYTDGAWDLFHPGHVSVLKAARDRGDYLIVGIHGDALVNKLRGMNLPLMNLHERVLSVLGCRFVDDVLIDAPYELSKTMIDTLRISEVVVRTDPDGSDSVDVDRFAYVKEAGILSLVDVPTTFQITNVIQRIQQNQERFKARYDKKKKDENLYLQSKQLKNMI